MLLSSSMGLLKSIAFAVISGSAVSLYAKAFCFVCTARACILSKSASCSSLVVFTALVEPFAGFASFFDSSKIF